MTKVRRLADLAQPRKQKQKSSSCWDLWWLLHLLGFEIQANATKWSDSYLISEAEALQRSHSAGLRRDGPAPKRPSHSMLGAHSLGLPANFGPQMGALKTHAHTRTHTETNGSSKRTLPFFCIFLVRIWTSILQQWLFSFWPSFQTIHDKPMWASRMRILLVQLQGCVRQAMSGFGSLSFRRPFAGGWCVPV